MLVGLIFFIGGAFAFALPKVSMVAMIIAGILGIIAGTTTAYCDMTVWGVVAFNNCGIKLLAGRKRKPRRIPPRPRQLHSTAAILPAPALPPGNCRSFCPD